MNAPSFARTRPLPAAPGAARHALQSILREADWRGDVDGVVLAVHEALINSHRHAGGAISVKMWMDGTDVVVEVRDRGSGFDVGRYAADPPEAMAERGRGLWLISQIADSWDVRQDEGVTRLSLRFSP